MPYNRNQCLFCQIQNIFSVESGELFPPFLGGKSAHFFRQTTRWIQRTVPSSMLPLKMITSVYTIPIEVPGQSLVTEFAHEIVLIWTLEQIAVSSGRHPTIIPWHLSTSIGSSFKPQSIVASKTLVPVHGD